MIVLSETEDLDWSVGNLAARVLDVMAFLSRKLLEGDLRHPCDGKVNIFLDLDDVVRQNMGHRLKAIINSEPESQKIFCASSQAGPSCSGDSKTPTTSPVAKMGVFIFKKARVVVHWCPCIYMDFFFSFSKTG